MNPGQRWDREDARELWEVKYDGRKNPHFDFNVRMDEYHLVILMLWFYVERLG